MIVIVLSEIQQSSMYSSLLNLMEERRIDFRVLCLSDEYPRFARDNKNVLRQFVLLGVPTRPWQLKSIWKIAKFLRLNHDGISTLYASGRQASFAAMTMGKFFRIKSRVFTRHHGSNHHHFNRLLSLLLDIVTNLCATRIIVVSRCVSLLLPKYEFTSKEKVIQIANGVNFSSSEHCDRCARGRQPGPLRIGTLSRTEDWKNTELITKCFFDLSKEFSDIEYFIVGSQGNAEERVATIIQTFRGSRITRIEHVENPIKYLEQLDIFVHTPKGVCAEAFGLVYLEAYSSGPICIFSKNGVLNELSLDSSRVLLVDVKQDNALLRVLREVVANEFQVFHFHPELHHLKERFSLRVMSEKYLQVLEVNKKAV